MACITPAWSSGKLGLKVQNIMGNQISVVSSLESTCKCGYYVSLNNLIVTDNNFE